MFIAAYRPGWKTAAAAAHPPHPCRRLSLRAVGTPSTRGVAGPWEMAERRQHGIQLCSCVRLCDPMDCSPLGSSVHGIFRQEHWSGLPFPAPGDLPDPGIEPEAPASPALAGTHSAT